MFTFIISRRILIKVGIEYAAILAGKAVLRRSLLVNFFING
jgi:hypothetical protein